MSQMAIQATDLGKQYKIPTAQNRYPTLREELTHGLKSLFRPNRRRGKRKEVIWALKEISFEAQHGETLGIIGPNGAGKSTLLKLLSRITRPTTGHIAIRGRIASLLEVGSGFHPELTGRENVFLNGAILGMPKQEVKRKFDEIVAFAETEKFIDTPVKRYSSGMYVRLAFAVAAHLEPDILVLDEVLAVGDAAFQKKCLGKMGAVAREGRTVLFVSHNTVAVNSLCRRAIWLNGGEIIEDGPSQQVIANYLADSLKGAGSLEEAWDEVAEAPGNHMVRLHRLHVRSENGSPSDPLTMETPFQIEVDCWNLVADAHLHITLHFYTAEGSVAFTTGSLNARPLPVGLFRSTCYVPGNLLNSGLHRLVLLVVKDTSSVIYRHESCVSFDILDMRKREGGWHGKEPGVVQPVLKWKTEYLGRVPEAKAQGEKGQ
jgi:lipopolysaccharide transport system ATP-binding protein